VIRRRSSCSRSWPAVLDPIGTSPRRSSPSCGPTTSICKSSLARRRPFSGTWRRHEPGGTKMWTWAWHPGTRGTRPKTRLRMSARSRTRLPNGAMILLDRNVRTAVGSAAGYPCNALLEVGDPVVGVAFSENDITCRTRRSCPGLPGRCPSSALGQVHLSRTFTAPPPICSGP